MKRHFAFILISICILCCCCNKDPEEIVSDEYIEFTKNFSLQEFEWVKDFILENGDRQTYSNFYSYNPHFSFDGFEAYLNPEIGQENINCDPEISDFNRIVIRDMDADTQTYRLLIVREGDLENEQIFRSVPEGIVENKIYLLNPNEEDVALLKEKTLKYIEAIKDEID